MAWLAKKVARMTASPTTKAVIVHVVVRTERSFVTSKPWHYAVHSDPEHEWCSSRSCGLLSPGT